MKKLMALFCAAMLFTMNCAQAQETYTAYAGTSPLVTISYDDSAYSLDSTSYLSTSRGSHIWLGMFYSSSRSIDCAADKVGSLTLDELQAYLDKALAGDHCSYLETYSAGSMSFLIYSLRIAGKQSYYAAAMMGSYTVHFELYNMRGDADSNDLGTLKRFLRGVSN